MAGCTLLWFSVFYLRVLAPAHVEVVVFQSHVCGVVFIGVVLAVFIMRGSRAWLRGPRDRQ